jgi:hypothetical protein
VLFLLSRKDWLWKPVLVLGFLGYVSLAWIALTSEASLSTIAAFIAALTISISVIYSLGSKAGQQRRTLYEVYQKPPAEFWAYRSMTSTSKYAIVFGIPLLVAVIDHLIFGEISYSNWLGRLVLIAAAILGLYLPSYVYREFASLVQEMLDKLPANDTHSKKDRATMTMFALVAGGSSTYQVATALITVCTYVVFVVLIWGLQGTFLFRPMAALVSIIIAGLVAPMTTTISAFVYYCRRNLNERLRFDVTATDGYGGFQSLATIGLSSSLMSALVAGIGVPVSLLSPGTAAPSELGLTLFMMFFVAASFVVPVHYAHSIIVSSKRKILSDIGFWYRVNLPSFDRTSSEEFLLSHIRLQQLTYVESVFARILKVNEWPSVYAFLGGAINTAIPIAVDLIGRFLKIF